MLRQSLGAGTTFFVTCYESIQDNLNDTHALYIDARSNTFSSTTVFLLFRAAGRDFEESPGLGQDNPFSASAGHQRFHGDARQLRLVAEAGPGNGGT